MPSPTLVIADYPVGYPALDGFVESWAEGKQNGREALSRARSALLEEFDIDRLSGRFQAAFV